jgi:hypothetical protein
MRTTTRFPRRMHEEIAPSNAASPLAPPRPGEIQKLKDGIYTMHQDVDEVLLTCAAVDEKGRLVTDLSRGDFRVWEDGVPQTTTSFFIRTSPFHWAFSWITRARCLTSVRQSTQPP